jgi:hypothetical protein
MWHRGDGCDRAVAKGRCGLRVFVKAAKDLARLRVLHEVDDGCMAAGHEHGGGAVQPFVNHRAPVRTLFIARLFAQKVLVSLVGGLVTAEMHNGIGHFIDMRLVAVGCCEHDDIAGRD